MFQRSTKRRDILDIVDADNSLVTHEFLRLFHEPLNSPTLASDCYAKAAWVLHLVGVQHVFVFARKTPEVRVEQGVTENNEQGFVVVYVREREAYCLPQALRVALEYSAGLAPFGFARQIAVHDFGLIAGDEDGLGGDERLGIANDPVDDGLSADGQQALGQVIGVGAHAFALAGNGQNDLHLHFLKALQGTVCILVYHIPQNRNRSLSFSIQQVTDSLIINRSRRYRKIRIIRHNP